MTGALLLHLLRGEVAGPSFAVLPINAGVVSIEEGVAGDADMHGGGATTNYSQSFADLPAESERRLLALYNLFATKK